jgi:transcription elongation GreA/GreB family factor
VSKAFLRDDALPPDDGQSLPPRSGSAPITPAGYARLRQELATLAEQPGEIAARRARALVRILKSVHVVEPVALDGTVGFGVRVTIEETDRTTTTYELVGPDEVDLAARHISVASPVAQALLGKRAGDIATIRRPKGDSEVTVVAVAIPGT